MLIKAYLTANCEWGEEKKIFVMMAIKWPHTTISKLIAHTKSIDDQLRNHLAC